MNRIEKLLQELCPNGVEYKELGEVVKIKNGKNWKKLGTGDIPVYGSGGIMGYVDTFSYNKPSVLIPRKGSLQNIFYTDGPIWNVDTIFYTEIGDFVIPKFLFYVVQSLHLEKMNEATTVPSQTQGKLNKIKIPIPP